MSIPRVLASETDVTQLAPQKTSWIAQVLRTHAPGGRIPELEFNDLYVPVVLFAEKGKLVPYIELKGQITGNGNQLLLVEGNGVRPLSSQGKVSLSFFLHAVLNEVQLKIIRSDGSEQVERVLIAAPGVQEYSIGNQWGRLKFSLGWGNFDYHQTKLGEFASLTGLVSVDYLWKVKGTHWSYYADLDLTAWTLSSSPTNHAPQILRVQAQELYSFFPFSPKFTCAPFLGIQYLTLFSNGSPFGFSNLFAPELGVKTRYQWNPENTVGLGFTYIPLDSLTSFAKISTDVYLTWSRVLRNKHVLELGIGNWSQSFSGGATTDVKAAFNSFRLGYSI